MKRNDAKSAFAYLVTRPARPRYQERTMDAGFIAEDSVFDRANTDRRLAAAHRMDQFTCELADNTAGNIEIIRAPAVLCSLLLLALGVTALLH